MADYNLVPVQGDPFQSSAYSAMPVQGDPFNPPQPSFWANTGTGAAKGVGNLLDAAGQAEMIEQQAPDSVRPNPGVIAQSVTNSLTGGHPYNPQSDLERAWQNIVSNTVTGLPTSMLGPGGALGLMARLSGNALGAVGGEAGERMLPNHPTLGRVIGSITGAAAGAGLLPKASAAAESAATAPPSPGFNWTPSKLAEEFPESQTAQAVAAKWLGNSLQPDQVAQQSPGILSKLASPLSWIESKLPEHSQFIPKLLAGEAGMQGLEWLGSHVPGLASLLAHPGIAATAAASVPAARGLITQAPQTAIGAGSSLLGTMSNSSYGAMPF